MVQLKEVSKGEECKINIASSQSETLIQKTNLASKVWLGLKNKIESLILKGWRFLEKAWDIGVEDPKKVIHCLKVGSAIAIVSLFYYLRPLHEAVGGNSMWAITTVVLVFETNVGATLAKSLNRIFGTFSAGFLAVGVQRIASKSGDVFEPIIVGASIFLLASAATFSRFIPSVKAQYDYGTMIFILTFTLVTISGYRVDKVFDMAHQRIFTIIIGGSLCILVSMFIFPIWAGTDLCNLTIRNMDKLVNSLDGCVAEYFGQSAGLFENKEEAQKRILEYKCVLNTKAREESMANFARWEPAHGPFKFGHPWKQYLKIGASIRSCAYCIEALNGYINSENQAPEFIKKHMINTCLKVSSLSSSVIKELAETIKTMKKSPTAGLLVAEMNTAVQELQKDLKSLPCLFNPTRASEASIPFMGMISMINFASLQMEIVLRIESIVEAVKELGNLS